ncbi:alanine racemase, partial [Fulvivirga sp. RKSG066]|uniref:alanine racemase n=1 Tax=Fulvivirga aurantia TaxID=2529383 RepID=UPI0012BC496A
LDGKEAAIHLKLDTGMHRLGFKDEEKEALIALLKANKNIKIESIFSHLAGADEETHNDYSHQQAKQFLSYSDDIIDQLQLKTLRHLANSPGIIRFPEYHLDMVRLGIGLYGVEVNDRWQNKLQPISSLKTIVSQINELKPGDTVGYSRKGVVNRNTLVATIAIGYADGFSRAFSNGKGFVFINGRKAPVLGNVCMDMTMVDVTDVPDVAEGDEVEIFGKNITISEVAGFINTIPYEILTGVSQRVKRVYYTE